jgi:hypothetical protein
MKERTKQKVRWFKPGIERNEIERMSMDASSFGELGD